MKVFHKFVLFILPAIVAAYSCSERKGNEDSAQSEMIVQTIEAQKTEYRDVLEFSGTFFANKEANVGSSIPGKVEKIHYRPGQYVNKGSLLVSMSTELLILSEVEYLTLEKDFERVSRLREKGSVSEQDYDHVKAKYEAAKAKYQLMKTNTQILAPFSGVVTDILVQEGENFMFAPSLDMSFSMTSGIVKLMQIHPIVVRFPLNEKLISQVQIGTQVRIMCDAYPLQEFQGKVTLIHPKFNTMTRTTDVEVSVSNTNQQLKPGMFARVFVDGIVHEGCAVPLTSMMSREEKDYIWTEQAGKAVLVEVEQLAVLQNKAIVLGVEPGTPVIISRKSQLADGMSVTVKN
jgi:membrane fusion protein, multidrug efflux system